MPEYHLVYINTKFQIAMIDACPLKSTTLSKCTLFHYLNAPLATVDYIRLYTAYYTAEFCLRTVILWNSNARHRATLSREINKHIIIYPKYDLLNTLSDTTK